mmetsp:Transcript_29129/g.59182  ORF Transcript_29129/g.59182 Transcript_29129/m.59182 type:complete len:468 (-) Transcript_29129:90-1493(-)
MVAWAMPISGAELSSLDAGETLDGTSGVHLLTSRGNGAVVFKPVAEEYLPEDALAWGLQIGGGMKREKAAFLLSELLGSFPGVPFTDIAFVNGHAGSVQRFVPNCVDMSDLGPNGIPDMEVQKLALLDLLTFNVDRHEGNIMLQQATKSLIPIDHAQCLPEVVGPHGANEDMLRSLYFAWQTWPQAKARWTDEAKNIVSGLSPENLAASLQSQMAEYPLSASALTSLKVGVIFLKACVAADISASKIADMLREELATGINAAVRDAENFCAGEWEAAFLKALGVHTRALFNIVSDNDTDNELSDDSELSGASTTNDETQQLTNGPVDQHSDLFSDATPKDFQTTSNEDRIPCASSSEIAGENNVPDPSPIVEPEEASPREESRPCVHGAHPNPSSAVHIKCVLAKAIVRLLSGIGLELPSIGEPPPCAFKTTTTRRGRYGVRPGAGTLWVGTHRLSRSQHEACHKLC